MWAVQFSLAIFPASWEACMVSHVCSSAIPSLLLVPSPPSWVDCQIWVSGLCPAVVTLLQPLASAEASLTFECSRTFVESLALFQSFGLLGTMPSEICILQTVSLAELVVDCDFSCACCTSCYI
jgi:hypothetical protein